MNHTPGLPPGTKLLAKRITRKLGLDLTINARYDRLTEAIMKRIIQHHSLCVDVGAHRGEVLADMHKLAPERRHYAFEPIPKLYGELQMKYGTTCRILPYALSDRASRSPFFHVKNAPAYSGLRQRDYETSTPDIEEIQVQLRTLDSIVPRTEKIDFVKLDVEGAELEVLRGARKTIRKNRPVIVFECGLGASNYYYAGPAILFDFIQNDLFLKISTLEHYVKRRPPLTKLEFCSHFHHRTEYYFVAHAW